MDQTIGLESNHFFPACCHQPMTPDPHFADIVGPDFFGPGEWSHWRCPKCGGGRHFSREGWKKMQGR